jgi:hypothetical protein
LHARGQPLLPCDLARTLNMPALQPRALASADWRRSGRERKLAVRTRSYHLCDSRATLIATLYEIATELFAVKVQPAIFE